MNHWDRFPYVRVAVLIAAFALPTAAPTCAGGDNGGTGPRGPRH